MKKFTLALVALFTLFGTTRADNWMKHLPDDEYVANVSLPGSHDSGTGNGCGAVLGLVDGTQYAKTQDLTIAEQFALGVRAFDLRPCVTEDNYLNINHGVVPTNIGFEEAMLTLRDSLIANPSEFIVIHLLHETDGEMFYSGSSDYEDLLHKTLEGDELKDYIVDFSRDLKVSDMRGKILILYRDEYTTHPVGGVMTNWAGYIDWNAQTNGLITGGGHGAGSYNTSTLYMQDLSNTSSDGMEQVKVDALTEMLDYTTQHYHSSAGSIVWVYNFASAYSKMTTINIIITSLSVSSAAGYGDNATHTNPTIIDYLAQNPGPTGIILADYVGVDKTTITTTEGGIFGIGGTEVTEEYDVMGKTLVESIIANNWTYIEYQPGNDREGLEMVIKRTQEKDITTNVGTGAFLISPSYADAITSAIEEAQTLLQKDDLTETECAEAIQVINDAVDAFDNASLNEPQEGELFNIILNADGFRYNGYAVTFYTGAYPGAGDYGLQFTSDIDPVYAQSFTFTHTPSAEKPEGYVISFVGVEGDTHYLCNGSLYGGTAYQIRTTSDESDAFVYEVELDHSQIGIWHLFSSESGTYVGSNGSSSLYASDNYPNLEFVVSNGVSVEAEIEGDWGTLILPLAAPVPDGLTAYSCASTNEGEVVLTAETTLAANTPYIVNGKGTYSFSGAGTYYSDYDLTSGLLTGTLLGTSVKEGAYVLADKGEGQAFYIVTEAASLPPYTCYLSVDDADPLSIYNLPGGTVAVKAIEADAESNASKALYDLSGRQVTNPRRGIYIRSGEKVLVK